jgi:hypothetical protein
LFLALSWVSPQAARAAGEKEGDDFYQPLIAITKNYRGKTVIVNRRGWTPPKTAVIPNTSERRSIKILAPELAARYGAQPGETVVANFRHKGKFWIAKFPKDGVRSVIAQIEYFPAIVPAAHTQLRFLMDKPVLLYPQVNPGDTSPVPAPKEMKDFIFSAEAVPADGVNFDVIKGLGKNFGLAHRFISTDDKSRYMIQLQKHKVEQIRLDYDNPALMEADLQAAIARSNANSEMRRFYHTWWASCTSELYDLLSPTVRNKFANRLAFLSSHIPTMAQWGMWFRGLQGKRSRLPTLNEERKYVQSGFQGDCPKNFDLLGYGS